MVQRGLLGFLILALLATGASTLLEGLLGADLTPGPVAMAATGIASVITWRTRKPMAGLIVSAWLALGPLAMPWTRDQLARPQHPGVFAVTVIQLAANATALLLAIGLQTRRNSEAITGKSLSPALPSGPGHHAALPFGPVLGTPRLAELRPVTSRRCEVS